MLTELPPGAKMNIDLSILNTKKQLLQYFQENFDEMYSANYDALIDVLTFMKEPLEINIKGIEYFENKKELQEVLDIIVEENPRIAIKFEE